MVNNSKCSRNTTIIHGHSKGISKILQYINFHIFHEYNSNVFFFFLYYKIQKHGFFQIFDRNVMKQKSTQKYYKIIIKLIKCVTDIFVGRGRNRIPGLRMRIL